MPHCVIFSSRAKPVWELVLKSVLISIANVCDAIKHKKKLYSLKERKRARKRDGETVEDLKSVADCDSVTD